MYKRRTAAELREMCEERGVACSGLKKAQLIELLEKYDDECQLVESNPEDGTPEDRKDVGMHEVVTIMMNASTTATAIVLEGLRNRQGDNHEAKGPTPSMKLCAYG